MQGLCSRVKTKSTIFADTALLARKNPGDWVEWPEKYVYELAKMRCDTIIAGKYVAFPYGCYDAELRDGDLWVKYIGQNSIGPFSRILICETS